MCIGVGECRQPVCPWPAAQTRLDVCDLFSWLWGSRTPLVASLHLTWALFPERFPQGNTNLLLRNDSGTPELRSQMPWMSSHLPFMFCTRKLRSRNIKKLTWHHTARPLMIQNRHGGHRHSEEGQLTISWRSVTCLHLPGRALHFRHYASFLERSAPLRLRWRHSVGVYLWETSVGAKRLPSKPLDLEEGLPGGSFLIQNDGAWVF